MKAVEKIAAELEPHCLSEKSKQLLSDLLDVIRGEKAFVKATGWKADNTEQ